MATSWIKVQLKNQNTVSIPLDQFLTMSDIEYEDLMNSNYGYYVDNIFGDKQRVNDFEKFDELDMEKPED